MGNSPSVPIEEQMKQCQERIREQEETIEVLRGDLREVQGKIQELLSEYNEYRKKRRRVPTA